MGRAKGQGCLYKKGKVYIARWVVNGKVYVRSTKTGIKKDALAKLKEFTHPYQVESDIEKLENLQSQINVLEADRKKTPKSKAIKLMFAVDAYRNDVNQNPIAEKTYNSYNSIFNALTNWAKKKGKEYAYQITQADADEFMSEQKKLKASSSYNLYVKTFKLIFYVLMRNDTNIRRNVFAKFKPTGEKNVSLRRELTIEELNKILEVAKAKDDEVWLMFMLGVYTGLRKIDVLTLRWDEVDIKGRMIRRLLIKTKKFGTIAHIPIVDELLEALKKAKKDGEYVLPTFAADPVKGTGVIQRVFKNAGITTSIRDENGHMKFVTGFHALRHTLASKLHREGMPINQIQTILGHRSINQSMYYSHVAERDLQMPSLTEETVQLRVKKDLYELVMKKAKGQEDFADVIKRVMTAPYMDEEVLKLKKEKEEAEAKKKQELDEMIDELMCDRVPA